MKYIKVKYYQHSPLAKQYVFKTHLTDLKEGDVVVANSCRGLGIAYVVGYASDSLGKQIATAWIVDKVDMDAHEERVAMEAELEALEVEFHEKAVEIEREKAMKKFAEDNPEMGELYTRISSLQRKLNPKANTTLVADE